VVDRYLTKICVFENIVLVPFLIVQGAKAKVHCNIMFAYSPTQCSLLMDASIFGLNFLRDAR